MRDFLLLLSFVSGCRESVCRRRRRSIHTVWSKCTPWDIQLSYCLGLNLFTFHENIQSAEWFFDGSDLCDQRCRQPSYECLECWTQHIKSLQEIDFDRGLLTHCIGEYFFYKTKIILISCLTCTLIRTIRCIQNQPCNQY